MTRMKFQRRDFLAYWAKGTSALALIAAAEGCKKRSFNSLKSEGSAGGGGKVRVRKAWHSLTGVEKALYKKAVAALQAEKVTGQEYKTQYQRLAFIHQNSCPHNNWFFLPWHRNYLALYEAELVRALGAEGADFALPYWDWTAHPEVMPEFYEAGSPLNPEFLHSGSDWALPRDVPAGTPMPEQAVGQDSLKRILATTDFYAFASYPSKDTNVEQEDMRSAGGLEGGPHNTIHGTLGGNMGAFLSPMDPIFWLHHCNVDRLWNAWMRDKADVLPYTPEQDSVTFRTRRGSLVVSLLVKGPSGGKLPDYAKYWLDYEFTLDAQGSGGDILHKGTRTKDVIDSTSFTLSGKETAAGFRYDTDPQPIAKAVAEFASAPRKRRTISSVDFNETVRAVSDTTFAAKIDTEEAKDVIAKFVDGQKAGKDVGAFVVIAGVPVPPTPELRNAMMIRLRIADADTRDNSNPKGELGTYSFFHHGVSGDHAQHAAHARPDVTISVDITQWLKGLGDVSSVESVWVSGAFETKPNLTKPKGWEDYRKVLPEQLKVVKGKLELTLVTRVSV